MTVPTILHRLEQLELTMPLLTLGEQLPRLISLRYHFQAPAPGCLLKEVTGILASPIRATQAPLAVIFPFAYDEARGQVR